MMDNNIELHTNTGDDSDNDVVTDFLNSNCSTGSQIICASTQSPTAINGHNIVLNCTNDTGTENNFINSQESQNYCIPIINAPATPTTSPSSSISHPQHHPHLLNNNNYSNNNNNNNNNMIPTINVTPHSPASANKYNNIFEDTLNQLQNIRESVVQMKNSSVHMHDGCLSNYGLINAAILSASLPDLSGGGSANGGAKGMVSAAAAGRGTCNVVAAGAAHFMMWSPLQQQQFLLQTNRRKSWTAIDDLTASAAGCIVASNDCTNKSVSLSSLDSEEQETIRVTEQRRRSARNSTGGISTHSLNEAELARDFERIAAKRNLATEIISRIPLQKSISTSSIVAKEDIKAIQRHLTDSEDENQSLLRAHAKIEVYDNVEKRRKRGSLFFRKKKDKTKMKQVGQASSCDACGATITLATVKDHHAECKGRRSSSISSGTQKISFAGVRKSVGGGGDKNDSTGQDYYDGGGERENSTPAAAAGAASQYNDDAPLIPNSEFLNDPPIEAQDLGADPILGIALEEHDSWSPSVPKEVLKSLKEKQVKRQEHIYEFIMTEKHHCQTLLVIQKVFVESLQRHFPSLNINKMFPRLSELSELHLAFLKKLRQKQREQYVIDSIADILLEFFSMEKAQHLRLSYGEFCANHRTALEQFKTCMTTRDQTFAEWYKHCLTNPLLKKKGIPECILFVTQRLTKYPLLIEPLLKSAREDKLEMDKLQHALNLVKALLVDVDACVAEKELRERQVEIFNRIDNKSFAIYKNKPFRKSDVGVDSRRRLKFEGLATLMQGRSKMQLVLVVVLTDCLCFLSENSAHNKYTFFTPEHKAGVVPLQKLLIREKAGTESRGIYIISSNPAFPEMYELKVQQPKDKNTWIQSIRQAVIECPSSDIIETEDLTAEEKLRIGVNKRELIEKMRQKDIEQALLLEEKIILQYNLLMKEHKHFNEAASSSSSSSSTLVVAPDGGTGLMTTMSAATFLPTFGSYKDLVNVDCDTAELWKRVLNTVQDISQLATTVYMAATGLPVSRSVSSVGEKQSETYSSPTLPKRAETFAGFDEKRAKNIFPCRDAGKLANLQVMSPRLQELEEKHEPVAKGSSSSSTMLHSAPSRNDITMMEQQQLQNINASSSIDQLNATKEHNYAALQVSHHLHTLLCIISQQMTTIHNLQLQLALYRENPRSVYTHNDQLEELRNLQDKLQEEKTAWLRQREQQEQELDDKRAQQAKLLEQIKAEQEDIRQQREQLYRKMEVLSSQGLLLSPHTPLMLASPPHPVAVGGAGDDSNDGNDAAGGGHYVQMGGTDATIANNSAAGGANTVDRRKDKWRTASTISKTPPVNLLSATNAPKANQTCVKQKIPMKLSSLSSSSSMSGNTSSGGGGGGVHGSTKIDKSASFNTSSSAITQLFPLKLADRQRSANVQHSNSTASTHPQLVPQHARTGSSPAIIQHPSGGGSSISTVNVTRTDSSATYTYGQRPTSANTPTSRNFQTVTASIKHINAPQMVRPKTNIQTTSANKQAAANKQAPAAAAEEEEIYF